MELGAEQQIFEHIKKAGKILIVLPEILTADSVASGLALRLFLTKLQKDVEVLSSGQIAENLKFLPDSELIKSRLALSKSLVISVATAAKKLAEISYESGPEKVQIFLKSEGQEFTPEDVSFASEKFPVDLIIVLEAESLEHLGRIYEQYTDLFFETPKINVDNKPSNEYFGAINMVDVTATSVAEILAELFSAYEQQLVDEDIATCLLAGIIDKTGSFQHVQTTPKAFLKASELVSLGGRQQEIIKNIYKTKSLALLKFWGRALARMKIQEEAKAVYSVLNFSDFEKAESTQTDVLPVLKEFVEHLSGYRIVAVLAEPAQSQSMLLAAVHEQVPLQQLLGALGEGAKILNLNLGNYRVLELNLRPDPIEVLEAKFLKALDGLPVIS